MKQFNEPSGGTENCLNYFEHHYKDIGEINLVCCDDQGLKILGDEGKIFLSGCKSGYRGQGAQGTIKILSGLGYTREEAEHIVFNSNRFCVIPVGLH